MIKAMEDEEHGRVCSIVPEGRITLDFYKNTVMHAFALAAFFATAVRALGEDRPDPDAVTRAFRLQQFLLRFEFVLDPDKDTAPLERDAVRALSSTPAVPSLQSGRRCSTSLGSAPIRVPAHQRVELPPSAILSARRARLPARSGTTRG